MKLIVCSKKNIASKNIFNLFISKFGFKESFNHSKFKDSPVYKSEKNKEYTDFELINTNKEIIDVDYLNDFFKPEIYIVASTHSSKSEEKTLTCHPTGNFSKAGLKGRDYEVCLSNALYLRNCLLFLKKQQNEFNDFNICFEATHHGPSSMNAPLMFVECGSTEKEWNNMRVCEIVCRAILDANCNNTNSKGEKLRVAVGFGGPHYTPNFSKDYVLDKIAYGHFCAKYNMDTINEEIVLKAFDKCVPKADFAVLDWKGLDAGHREKLVKIFEKNRIKWVKVGSLKE